MTVAAVGGTRWVRTLFVLLTISLLLFTGFATATHSQAGSELSFGFGAGIQVIDPAGAGAAPIWLPSGDVTVDYALYALSDDALVARYRDGWTEPAADDVTGLLRVAGWSQAYAPSADDGPVALQKANMPADVPSGLYILEAALGEQRATLLVNVSDVALLARRGNDGVYLFWAARLQTGAPVAGMEISVYAADGSVLQTGATDADGLARLELQSALPHLAVGHTDSTRSVVGLTSAWQNQSGAWWTPEQSTPAPMRVHLHTDRPIYRPGQTVFFNAILRTITTAGYARPAQGTETTLALYDARDNLVATQTQTVDAMGTVNGRFVLADEPPLGTYRLELAVDGVRVSHKFAVEAYTKPEYQVQLETPAQPLHAGDLLPVTVRADYFFGQPVADAAVTLEIFRTAQYDFWYAYDDLTLPGPGFGETLVAEETGVTDGAGLWTFDYRLPADDEGVNWTYRLVVTVTDARNRPIEAQSTVPVFWSDVRLQVASPRYGYAAGAPVDLRVQADDQAGNPRPAQTVTLRLVRAWSDELPVLERTVTTDAQGRGATTITDLPQGWYRVTATSLDGRGRTATAETYLWVYAAAQDWWWTSDETISLSLDKASYAPGDTATLLIQARVGGIGLLTLQRDTVIDEMIVPLTGPVTAVEIPVTTALTPNVHLTFHLFQPTAPEDSFRREGSLVFGRTELRAPAEHALLDVQIATDQNAYRPGAEARITVTLTDHAGTPQRGRVTLAVVDEAIFALAQDRAGSIVDAFYAPDADRTAGYDSLVRNPEYYGAFPETDDGESPPDPTPTTGPREPDLAARGDAQQARRTFLDTAYWNATLDTDADGRVTVTVPLPDNLTTWRVTAKAVTVDTKVGEAQTSLLVSQEMIARPVLPRFALLGDRFAAGVIAQNNTGAPAASTVAFDGAGLLLLDPGARTLTVPDGGSAAASWTVVAAEVGNAPVLTSVTADAGQDAVETPLLIKPFSVPARVVAAGQADPVAEARFDLPLNAVNDASSLTVRLTPSLALGVLDGLDELIEYPYGCVEQTLSRLLPTAAAARVYAELGLVNPRADELPDLMNQGLQSLYGFQQEDGGWGWFFDDDGAIYTTAYVLFGLSAVEQSGFAVDAQVAARGFAYLTQHYPQMTNAGMQVFVQYVLAQAGRGDPAAVQALAARAQELDAAGLATLALTLDALDDAGTAQPVVDRLLRLVRAGDVTAYWPAPEGWDEFSWRMMTSNDKSTALAVAALTRLRPGDEHLPKAVRWLMEHRRGAGWSNTQATAFSVLALLDYLKLSGELALDYGYRVELNGETVFTGRVTPATVATPIAPLVIPGTSLVSGENRLSIVREGAGAAAQPSGNHANGSLYYTAVMEQALFFDTFQPVASTSGGIDVSRTYTLLEGTARDDGAVNVGDVVQVTLEVELADEMYYLLIEDPIPAGFDVIRERENPFGWREFDAPLFWREWGYNRKEVRDDRVDFFVTEGRPGRHTFTYTMRAVMPGEFGVPPALVYPMYADHFWGRSGSNRVTVTPDALTLRPLLAGDFDGNCGVTDFDLQLVAAAWAQADPARDVVPDGIIDLADLAAVAHRRGAACLADLPLPAFGAPSVGVVPSVATGAQVVGAEFAVTVALQESVAPAGLALQLDYDANRLWPLRVEWPNGITMIPLGPMVDLAQGRLLFGAYAHGDTAGGAVDDGNVRSAQASIEMPRVIFAGIRPGMAAVTVVSGQVADTDGRVHAVESQSTVTVEIRGEQSFLPMIQAR